MTKFHNDNFNKGFSIGSSIFGNLEFLQALLGLRYVMSEMLKVTPSLIYKYAKSPHWVWYDLFGDQAKKTELSEFTKKLIEGGVIHEKEYIENLDISHVNEKLTEEEAELQTLKLMQEGAKLIYQGVISYEERGVLYRGKPDLLEKQNGHSKFGGHYYIPIEIKNSKNCEKTEYKMQLVFYADILEKIQNVFPEKCYFINKNKEKIELPLTSKLCTDTREKVKAILDIIKGNEPPLKITLTAKETPWFDVLIKNAKDRNDIALIYGLNANSLESLRNEGIRTIQDFIGIDINKLPKIKGASIETLQRTQQQAQSLFNNEVISLEKPPVPEGKTKVYFDIEGDPLLNVQYLFGLWMVENNKEPNFKYFLAKSPKDEKKMWQKFLDWLEDMRLDNYKVYHYHHYELTQLKKLKTIYGSSEKLEDFIQNLVDLLPIIKESAIFPLYSYSLKDIAKYLF